MFALRKLGVVFDIILCIGSITATTLAVAMMVGSLTFDLLIIRDRDISLTVCGVINVLIGSRLFMREADSSSSLMKNALDTVLKFSVFTILVAHGHILLCFYGIQSFIVCSNAVVLSHLGILCVCVARIAQNVYHSRAYKDDVASANTFVTLDHPDGKPGVIEEQPDVYRIPITTMDVVFEPVGALIAEALVEETTTTQPAEGEDSFQDAFSSFEEIRSSSFLLNSDLISL